MKRFYLQGNQLTESVDIDVDDDRIAFYTAVEEGSILFVEEVDEEGSVTATNTFTLPNLIRGEWFNFHETVLPTT